LFPDRLNFAQQLDAQRIELARGDTEAGQISRLQVFGMLALFDIGEECALDMAEPDRIRAKYLVLFGRDRNSRVISENRCVLL
jgi:hypothetical protein